MKNFKMKTLPAHFKWPIFTVIAASFLLVKRFGLHYTASGDENAYFYMAKLMGEGKLFYRDFFFAHPPLQLLLLTVIHVLFGFRLVLYKLIAALPVLAGAGFIYHQLWRRKEGRAAVFFLIVYLFNYELLKITSHPFGLNLTAFFLMLSLYFFLEEKPFAGGVSWGFASLTGFYALPWGLIPVGYYVFQNQRRRNLLSFLGSFILVFGLVNAVFILSFGEKYITPVFLYHFLKPPGEDLISDVFIMVIRRNILLFFLPFLYIWIPKGKQRTAVLSAGILYLLFLASLNPLFTQYFMLPLGFMAWAGATNLSDWIDNFRHRRARLFWLLVSLIALGGVSADDVWRFIRHERGTTFQTVAECKDFILKNSSSKDLLFGHVTTVPLLALLTGRDIALDMVDTNHMRFKAGLPKIEDVLETLKGQPRLKFFIIQESQFWMGPEVRAFLENCRPAAVFDEARARILIFDCRE